MVALGHPGSVAGYLSAAYLDPVTRTGAIVLRNVDDKRFVVLGVCLQVFAIAAGQRFRNAVGTNRIQPNQN